MSEEIAVYQQVKKRLSAEYPENQTILDRCGMKLAGFFGEASLAYSLSHYEKESFRIFHDLRLYDGKNFFQLDFLILTSSFAAIIEVKNIAGKLYFDVDHHQLLREKDGITETFSCPLLQVRMHKEQLNWWLYRYGIHDLPIVHFVVISNPRTQLKFSTPTLSAQVMHQKKLYFALQDTNHTYTKEYLDIKTLKKLQEEILREHHPIRGTEVLKNLGITSDDLIPGIICPSCDRPPLIRLHGRWTCEFCEEIFKDEVCEQTLKDMHLFYENKVPLAQIQDFLNLSSSQVTKRICKKFNIPVCGRGKATRYVLDAFDR
ncbi:nuclease-related domain-containing protein [Thalassobacillus hwangdonensis]|uniref:Nuclease-related domain-containing protein n=2 Tax=Thalassobacillus hwangdonensis TaxID=546108 RepID=A0ABW3L612_9BACI